VDQALNDKWIRDAQCLSDITKLEEEVNSQWLTSEIAQAGTMVETI